MGHAEVRDMGGRWIGTALVAGVVVGLAGSLSAQQSNQAQPSIVKEDDDNAAPVIVTPQQPAKPARKKPKPLQPTVQVDPNLDANDQLAPSQVQQPMPGAVAEPSAPARKPAATHATEAAAAAPPSGAPAKPAGREAHVVACSGVFGKNSSHLKLAMVFETKNVDFAQVDAGPGNTTMASVLFAKDPKRRLEVWWTKQESRSDTHLIVINGQSTWTAPGNLRLGLTLAEVEKLNHKPFKLMGFNKDNVAAGSDWNGGALAAPPGGCKLGISFHADAKATADQISALPADKEFASDDPAMRATNPKISEILVGY
jgi:hypothetical protein